MRDGSATEVEAAFDGEPGTAFDRLCQQLTQHDLFGEILGAHHQIGTTG